MVRETTVISTTTRRVTEVTKASKRRSQSKDLGLTMVVSSDRFSLRSSYKLCVVSESGLKIVPEKDRDLLILNGD